MCVDSAKQNFWTPRWRSFAVINLETVIILSISKRYNIHSHLKLTDFGRFAWLWQRTLIFKGKNGFQILYIKGFRKKNCDIKSKK
jgi:hypothetical protein